MKVNTLKLNSPNYPVLLSQLHDPPQALYWAGKGPGELMAKPRLAVVGSRKATAYGRQITEEFVTKLARSGVVIVSGLALGIDTVAHLSALKAGGETIAVLPSGLDRIYPAGHINVARQIAQNGALVSEYAAGTIAFRTNFIARNRIVSGLSDGLLITEAAANSGTMHTARFALEQGKTVIAIPGNINSRASDGCNNLIKAGALVATNVQDVFFGLGLRPDSAAQAIVFNGSADEQLVFDLIKDGQSQQEQLADASRIPADRLAGVLTSLELSGYIRPAGGGNWIVA